jgi:hypothetical protein
MRLRGIDILQAILFYGRITAGEGSHQPTDHHAVACVKDWDVCPCRIYLPARCPDYAFSGLYLPACIGAVTTLCSSSIAV